LLKFLYSAIQLKVMTENQITNKQQHSSIHREFLCTQDHLLLVRVPVIVNKHFTMVVVAVVVGAGPWPGDGKLVQYTHYETGCIQ
jgi:hypothetical protein